jgi:hypothetical protein
VNPAIIKNTKIIPKKNPNPNYKKNTTLSRAKLSTKGKYNIH